jgi:hypothetical protein
MLTAGQCQACKQCRVVRAWLVTDINRAATDHARCGVQQCPAASSSSSASSKLLGRRFAECLVAQGVENDIRAVLGVPALWGRARLACH